mmetsp:Transcript_70028/g.135186  ORF Transcript_70028/g.135186 Transcript_70028/m.135186 type:complete len:151 (-) Transcript_70028:438-890(-)
MPSPAGNPGFGSTSPASFHFKPSVGSWHVRRRLQIPTSSNNLKIGEGKVFDDNASTVSGSGGTASTGCSTPVSVHSPVCDSAMPKDDRFYPLEVLTDPKMWRNDPNINPEEREKFLSAEIFQSVFGMAKEDFSKLPKWRQELLKKNHLLF